MRRLRAIALTAIVAAVAASVVLFGLKDDVTLIEGSAAWPASEISDSPPEALPEAAEPAPPPTARGEIDGTRGTTLSRVSVTSRESNESILARILDSGSVWIRRDDDRMETEPVDADWAPRIESHLWSLLSTIGDVLEARCRTTACRAILLLSDTPELESGNRVLTDSLGAIVSASDGHLESVSIQVFPSPGPDGQTAMVIHIVGPPLEE